MTPLPLPTQTLAWLKHAADSGQQDAQVMLHLIARADAQDQWFAMFSESYSKTIASLCRKLEALERRANDLPALEAPADDSPVADALLQAEAALADVAEGMAVSLHAHYRLEVAHAQCTEALAAIRPVMRRHGIRTSEFPPAAPAPANPTPPPTAPANGLLETVAAFDGNPYAAIHAVATWLEHQQDCPEETCKASANYFADLLRDEIR